MKKFILPALMAALVLASCGKKADGAAKTGDSLATDSQKVEATDAKAADANVTPEAAKAEVAKILADADLKPEDIAAGDDVEGYAVVYKNQVAAFFKKGTEVNVGQKVTDLVNKLKAQSEDGKLYEDSREFISNENPKVAKVESVDEINKKSSVTYNLCYRKNGQRFYFTVQAGVKRDYKVGAEKQYLESLSVDYHAIKD